MEPAGRDVLVAAVTGFQQQQSINDTQLQDYNEMLTGLIASDMATTSGQALGAQVVAAIDDWFAKAELVAVASGSDAHIRDMINYGMSRVMEWDTALCTGCP